MTIATSEGNANFIQSTNSFLSPEPFRIPLDEEIVPNSSLQLSVIMHASRLSEHNLSLLLVFRDVSLFINV